MFGFLRPNPTLTEQDIQRSLRLMRWDGVAAGAMFSLGSGGFMAAYALALGTNNLQIGILAALPHAAQVVQLPAALAIERFRRRKAIGLPAWYLAQLMWLPIRAVPFLLDTPGSLAITVVIVLLALRGLFAPIWGTATTKLDAGSGPSGIVGAVLHLPTGDDDSGGRRVRLGRQLLRGVVVEHIIARPNDLRLFHSTDWRMDYLWPVGTFPGAGRERAVDASDAGIRAFGIRYSRRTAT